MKRRLPIFIAFGIGLFMAVQYFVPHRYVQNLVEEINRWANLIWAAALILGTLSLTKHLTDKMLRQREGWGYAVVAMLSMIATIVTGFWGVSDGTPFMWVFRYVLAPMEATTFSLLAFYIASAAFRAFRARNIEATLLLVAATLIMIGRVPIGHAISEWLPATTDFILDFPNTAAKRGIMIGVGLGMVATALKIILGIERGYLGDKG
ncbi:MAG: hypothetical protein P9L99_10305 [Candidatus Lernaella stagnicola]|nr:hypothetical protein [Candidatus Lernaella stagnicola]